MTQLIVRQNFSSSSTSEKTDSIAHQYTERYVHHTLIIFYYTTRIKEKSLKRVNFSVSTPEDALQMFTEQVIVCYCHALHFLLVLNAMKTKKFLII